MERFDEYATLEDAISAVMANSEHPITRTEAKKRVMETLPREQHYQTKIMHYLKKEYPEGFIWKATAGAYSVSGIPDICMILHGNFYGFEVKRPLVGVASAIQQETIRKINAAGGHAGIVVFPKDAQKIIDFAEGKA